MKTKSLLNALPLCCMFLAAADQRDCNININIHHDGSGEGEGEGAQGEGEGEGDTGECQQDSDCGPGLVCELDFSTCPPCTDPSNGGPVCDIACQAQGKCVPPPPPPTGCESDSDCGFGSFCDFSQCGVTNGGPSDQPIACNGGVCEPLPPPPPDQCEQDSDCGPGFACINSCSGGGCGAPPTDPNGNTTCANICVEVDPCGGQCDPTTSQCVIQADGTATCEPFQGQCSSDADCASGETCQTICASDNCDPTTGACSNVCFNQCEPPPPPPPTACNTDADCPQGDKCVEVDNCPACTNSDPACEVPCQVSFQCVDASGTPVPPSGP